MTDLELIKSGQAEVVRRISNRKTLYKVETAEGVRYPIYNRSQKRIDLYEDIKSNGFRVGDSVGWQTTNGRHYRGKIVYVVPTGTRVEGLIANGTLRRYNVRPITNMSPRGQESYLVSVRQGEDFTLYWPPVSRLRKGGK